MRSLRTSGSVGRAPGNRCLYPEGDALQRPLHFRFRARLMPGVRPRNQTRRGHARHASMDYHQNDGEVRPWNWENWACFALLMR